MKKETGYLLVALPSLIIGLALLCLPLYANGEEIKIKPIIPYCDLPVKIDPTYPTGMRIMNYQRCSGIYYKDPCKCRKVKK